MNNPTERLVRRTAIISPRRPGAPRELRYDSASKLLTWTEPADKSTPFSHYRVRLDTDDGAPAFEVGAGQTSAVIYSAMQAFVSTYNDISRIESARVKLLLDAGAEVWTPLVIANGGSGVSPFYPAVSIRMKYGSAQVSGAIVGGTLTDGTVAATVPTECRPLAARAISAINYTTGVPVGAVVRTNGDIQVYGVAGGGIVFGGSYPI